jgi:hypothetical protein
MADWHPAHKFNLLTGSPLAFRKVVSEFEKWSEGQPTEALGVSCGWYVVTPQMAERFLRRNPKNRAVHFPTIVAYATQLINGEWQKTGQPLIFTDWEDLLDGQHRLWACYLTNRSFETYIVTGVESKPHLFAYVDNNKPRTAGDALETAGLNGLSRHVATVINSLAYRSDQGALTFTGRSSVGELSPREVLGYMQDHPELLEAAHYVEDNHKSAKSKLGPAIATFIAWKSIALNGGTEQLDVFLDAMLASDLPVGHPVQILRKLINPDVPSFATKAGSKAEKLFQQSEYSKLKERIKVKPLGLNLTLAYAITAYNHLQRGETKVGKLLIDPSEPFPEVEAFGVGDPAGHGETTVTEDQAA